MGWLVYQQREALVGFDWQINVLPLVGTIVLYGIALWSAVLEWALIFWALGDQTGFWDHFRFFCLSNLAKRLPGTVWYVIWRANLYSSVGHSTGLTSLASGIEVVVSVVSGVIVILLFAIPIILANQLGFWGILVLCILSLIVLHPKVLGWLINRFAHQSPQISYKDLFIWLILNLVNWIAGGGILFFTIAIFHPIGIDTLGYVIGAWTLVGVLSIALFFFPTNFGFNQLGISLLLSSIIPLPIAVIIAVVNRILITLFELIIAVVILMFDRLKR